MGRWHKPFLAFVFAAAASSLAVAPRVLPAGPSLAPLDALPAAVRSAPPAVQEAYRYALAHPDLLKTIPCYCGCEVVRHRSNYDCYVEEVLPDGSVVFSDHGLGWGVCVKITRDVMRLDAEGKSAGQIRRAIDEKYGFLGEGTDTPHPGSRNPSTDPSVE